MKPGKIFLLAIATLSIFTSMLLLAFFGEFQKSFADANAISAASPIGIMAIAAIFVFGGIYFFKAAAHIMKGAL